MRTIRLIAFAFILLAASNASAWNALGHKTIAALAWDELPPATRAHIVATLRRHPRFAEDFVQRQPDGLTDADEDEWTFQHAATWPDLARGLAGEARRQHDHPTWHYINVPIFHGGERPIFDVNTSVDYPAIEPQSKWNIIQATKHCIAALKSDATPSTKAQAYCWLLHLVGDSHQPLHSVALFSDRFPTGDRGGNSIKTVQGENLHSLWDNALGREHKPNDVKREVAELRARPALFDVETGVSIEAWIAESNDLAKSFVYSPGILEAVEPRGDLPPINLLPEYLKGMGDHARRRIAAAGVRLGALLNGLPISEADKRRAADVVKEQVPKREAAGRRSVPVQRLSPGTAGAKPTLGYWLNTNGNVRHNASCRWYQSTNSGRPCSATEGKPCGICGG